MLYTFKFNTNKQRCVICLKASFFLFISLLISTISCAQSIPDDPSLIQNPGESLSQRWLLNDDTSKRFKIIPYKPVYFLVANYTTNINNTPTSDNPLNTVGTPFEFSDTELKFQISFKTRAVRNILGGDLWIGYTQSSRWQLYSANISRPFRETNYDPEVMFILPTKYRFLGLNGVFTGIGINHQSNGRSNPLSRSWNRVVLQLGLETTSWSIVLRPWLRLQEDAIEDNNPNIEDYVGRAELLTAYSKGKHDLSIILRHSLRGGSNSRGAVRVDYAFNILDNLQLHTIISSEVSTKVCISL